MKAKLVKRLKRCIGRMNDDVQRAFDGLDEFEGLPHGNLIYVQAQLAHIENELQQCRDHIKDFAELLRVHGPAILNEGDTEP